MRRGRTFKRCTKCGGRIAERRCPKCGGDRFTWAYAVDDAPKGAPRHQTTKAGFANKREAEEALTRLKVAKEDGTHIEPSKLTVGQYLEQWLAGGCGGDIRTTTLTGYQVAVRVHIAPRLGNVKLQQLTTAELKRLYQELRTEGHASSKNVVRGLSAKSIHNIALAVRKALADAVDDGLLKTNPAERSHRFSKKNRPEMLTWSATELRTFFASVDGDPNYPMWRLAANTGMRRGELLGLRWRDVDLDGGRLSVQQQLLRSGKEVTLGVPKTDAGRRSISLDRGTVEALRRHRATTAKDRLRWGAAYQDHDLVFCRPDGHPHDPDVVTHQFETASKRAKVKRIRLHDLRHTHATLLLQANVHPKVVQERLGHSSVMVTLDTYSHVIPNMQDEAAARIGAVVDGV